MLPYIVSYCRQTIFVETEEEKFDFDKWIESEQNDDN
jgi:hypothetical protein